MVFQNENYTHVQRTFRYEGDGGGGSGRDTFCRDTTPNNRLIYLTSSYILYVGVFAGYVMRKKNIA